MKSHCLGGKRNRRIDYIIQALVFDFLSDIENRHKQQIIGLEGPDLEDTRRQQILATARNISPDSIQKVSDSDTRFLVASESRPGHRYTIDLEQPICNCADFPRIRFCKHIAAINVQSSLPPSKASKSSEIPKPARAPDLPQITLTSVEESVDTLIGDINALCERLNAVTDDAIPDLKALKSAKLSLKKAIDSANRSRALPERDPNRNRASWPITTQAMGAGTSKTTKRKHGPASETTLTEVPTEQRIGAVKGKRRKDPDPYAAGERSGKRAKPDALSAAANERARAAAPPPLSAAVHFPALPLPSAASASCAEGYLTRANRSEALPLTYPPSSGVPGLALSPFPAASPGHAFAPLNSATIRSAYALSNAGMYFRGQITSGNAHAHTHFSPGHST